MAYKFNLATEIRKGAREAFRKSPQHKAALKAARIERERLKKDGTPAKTPAVFYQCNDCGGLFKPNAVQVDHIVDVGPAPGTRNAPPTLTWDVFFIRMFCGLENLQVLCKSCHLTKTRKGRT